MTIPLVTTRAALREALGTTAPGFVPTMGALHAGHTALITRAAADQPRPVVSIFVNPTQFGDAADLENYPRDLEADRALAAEAGAGLIFAPSVSHIYPPGAATRVDPGPLAAHWEGAARPGHFTGVATVVAILLNLVRPSRAYFGEKDFQQLAVLRQISRDLALPGEIVGCPTVRDHDELALSSRNRRLSAAGRTRALAIPAALTAMTTLARAGETDVLALRAAGLAALDTAALDVDYLAVVDAGTLAPVTAARPGDRIIVAATVDGVRLIDNAPLPAVGA